MILGGVVPAFVELAGLFVLYLMLSIDAWCLHWVDGSAHGHHRF